MPVWDAEVPGPSVVFFVPSVVWGVVVLLARAIQGIVDAAWFGLAEPRVLLEVPGPLWVSHFVASAACLAFVRCTGILFEVLRTHPIAVLVRKFVTFLVLLYWIAGLHAIIIIGRSTGDASDWLWGGIFDLLIISSLSALLWPLTFGLSPFRPARGVFFLSLATLGLVLIALDPDVLVFTLSSLGVTAMPGCLFMGTSFPDLVYLAPLPPVLWATYENWRYHRHRRQA
jgi:hypothetical protein